jgi:hypothetical protein
MPCRKIEAVMDWLSCENMTENNGQITVKVDRSLEVEKEKAEKAQIAKEFEEFKASTLAKEKARLGCDDDSITTLEELTAWQLGKNEHREMATGTAYPNPSSGGVYPQNPRKGYEDYGAMLEDLRAQEKTNPNAKAIIDAFYEKFIKNVKEGKTNLNLGKYGENEDLKETLNRMAREEIKKQRGIQ